MLLIFKSIHNIHISLSTSSFYFHLTYHGYPLNRRQMYLLNFQTTTTTGSTTTTNSITLEKDVKQCQSLPFQHDILTGGFPCQPFSRSGTQTGFNTEKGTLFHEIVRLLKSSQPKSFLLENVTGLLHLPGTTPGELPLVIRQALEEVGYTIQFKIIDSSCMLPQIRRRCYIVGFLNSEFANSFTWPILPKLNRSVAGDDGILISDPENSKNRKSKNRKQNFSLDSVFQLTETQWNARLERCSDPSMWLVQSDSVFGTLTRNYRSCPGRKAAALHSQRIAKRRKTTVEGIGTSSSSTDVANSGAPKIESFQVGKEYIAWEQYKQKKVTEEKATAATEAAATTTPSITSTTSTTTSATTSQHLQHRSSSRGWSNLISKQLDWEVYLNDTFLSHISINDPLLEQTLAKKRDTLIRNTNQRPRYFSHRECSRLMGFPAKFQILREKEAAGPATALYGNAVCPPIVGAIAACMLRALNINVKVSNNDDEDGEDEEDDIGDWNCIGTRTALQLTLQSLPNGYRRQVLCQKIKKMSLLPIVEENKNDDIDDEKQREQELQICYRFRDTGSCSWGDKCRWQHT